MTTNNHPAHGPVSLERLHQIREILSKAAAQSDGGNLGYAMADAVKVIDGAIAAFGADPVGYADPQSLVNFKSMGGKNAARTKEWMWRDPYNGLIPLYTAPPAPVVSDREKVRREHAEWSDVTFGDVGPVGPLKHLSKEALEAAAEPGDLSEWADMQFLLWDAQRRAGISDEQITLAMVEKLAVNKQRQWPEPKDGEPRLHIKEAGNSPVTPDCWCRTCRPVTMSDMRFVVCPDCGNKRCPHANDHRNACTGSNELGQIGSAYPAAPQQEVKNG